MFEVEDAPLFQLPKTAPSTKFERINDFFFLLIDLVLFFLLIHTLEPLLTQLHRNGELFNPSVTLPQLHSSVWSNSTGRSNEIPRILHQTAATEKIPQKWIDSQRSCKESEILHSSIILLWTDDLTRRFLSERYPCFVDIWDNYAFPIQRSGSLRYFVLHHYGGIYLDMDTWCNDTIHVEELKPEAQTDYALFKSTLPTGVTNDFMITTARHPVFEAAIAELSAVNSLTRAWARWQPYSAIMISAGPMFLTLVLKEYLLHELYLPSSTIGVVNSTQLTPYITDLESCTWHQADAKFLMWIEKRPWTWFMMGAMALVLGFHIFNRLLTSLFQCLLRRTSRDAAVLEVDKDERKYAILSDFAGIYKE